MVSDPFFAKILDIPMTGSLEMGKFLQKQSVLMSSNCASAAFNWVLSVL